MFPVFKRTLHVGWAFEPNRYGFPNRSATIIVWIVAIICATNVVQADSIVLRSLQSIDKPIESFDIDGIRFADKTQIGWDEVKAGTVDSAKQQAFDNFIKTLGEDLYRVRVRLKNRDYGDLRSSAEAVYPHYAGRGSKTAYMVCQAVMWARLADGDPAAAVAPYLHCYVYLRSVRKLHEEIPGDRKLQFDALSGMTPEIPPLWFDRAAAKQALPELTATIRTLPAPIPLSAKIYFGTMAVAAGDTALGDRVLRSIGTPEGELVHVVAIALALRDLTVGEDSGAIDRLESLISEIGSSNRPLAAYVLATAQVKIDPQRLDEGLLDLMRFVAIYGQDHPALAAAALAAAIQATENVAGDANGVAEIDANRGADPDRKRNAQRASIFRKELLRTYPTSHHAREILRTINVAQDSSDKSK
ncbi:MAG: hypothetical protein R3C05_19235 [Pirellulaceae bacterium]